MPSKKSAARKASAVAGGSEKSAQPDKITKNAAKKSGGIRRITPKSYVSRLRRTKAARSLARNKLPSAFRILYRALRLLTSHWEVFGGLLLIYAILNMVLIGGFSSAGSLEEARNSITDLFTGNFSQVATGFALFGFLLQSGTTVASGVASAYQSFILIIISLATVWGLRQFHAGNRIRIRDTLYRAMYPLIPVIFVLLIICVQLLPAVAGSLLFSALVVNGILVAAWQQILVIVFSLLLVLWTLYMLTASVFAVYIVALPDMTPFAALRSAKEIVRHRRGRVLRKLLFLPFIMLVASVLVLVPLAILWPTLATAIFFLLSMVSLFVVHAYLYQLYRELIER